MFTFIANLWKINSNLHNMLFWHPNFVVRIAKHMAFQFLVITLMTINPLAALALVFWNLATCVTDMIIDLA